MATETDKQLSKALRRSRESAHERTIRVQRARLRLSEALLEITQEQNLSVPEILQILGDISAREIQHLTRRD